MSDDLHPGRPQEPAQLAIPAGLGDIPRQIGLFPAFRAALLEDASRELALTGAGWRGREVNDFGVMLLEMWAYVCDVLAFYDQFIAGESYLRTAMQLTAARRLVSLIGYVPTPAIAALADLAFTLTGRVPVSIPAGSAFRSGAFDGEKPQVFTVMDAVTLHPLRDKFTLPSQPAKKLGTGSGNMSVTQLTFTRGTVTLKKDDRALVHVNDDDHIRAVRVKAITDGEDAALNPVTRVQFAKAFSLSKVTQIAQMTVERGTQIANLSSFAKSGKHAHAKFTSKNYDVIRLDTVNKSIRPGHYIILSRDDEDRWFKVTSVGEAQRKVANATTITVNPSGPDNSYTVETPAVYAPVTALTLDASVNANAKKGAGGTTWKSSMLPDITLYYGFVSGGTLRGEAKAAISANDPLKVNERVETIASEYEPEFFILKDLDERAVQVDGALGTNRTLTVSAPSKWTGTLMPPVTLYGAIARATRGELVANEILGVGDGSTPNQWFKLKKPLTYLNAPSAASAAGVQSTLEIRVDGVKWKEVPRFYGVEPDASVYVVRENDDGESVVTFGDGARGARLPSGAQVTARYYTGAGAAAPPAGSITQQVTPIKGVSALTNPLPAFGGADAEDESSLKTYAPRSALLLGRAVSLVDYEAVAAGTSGVRLARAEWQWSQTQQRPVVQIWYIGEGSLGALVKERLAGFSAPGTPFGVAQAQPVARALGVTVLVNPNYVMDTVTAEVKTALDEALKPEKLGVGARLFRSVVLSLAAQVEGVVAPVDMTLDGSPLNSAGVKADTGKYFEFTITVSGQPAPATIPSV